MNSPHHLFFSFRRLWTIGQNTMTEVIRQKFFYILAIFGIVVLVSSNFFSQFSNAEQIKFVKDFGLAVITVFGTLIAIVGTAQLLPLELENRTIYPILAKPVFRAEFLLGKYLGMIALLFLIVILMGLIFGGLLFYTEKQLIHGVANNMMNTPKLMQMETQETVAQILKQTRDPNLFKAIVLIYFKVAMISTVSLLISTFATSVIFNVITSVIVYICGHLESTARQAWLEAGTSLGSGHGPFMRFIFLLITLFVPDLNAFNIADEVVIGQSVPLIYVVQTIQYGIFYAAVALLMAYFIFQKKEI